MTSIMQLDKQRTTQNEVCVCVCVSDSVRHGCKLWRHTHADAVWVFQNKLFCPFSFSWGMAQTKPVWGDAISDSQHHLDLVNKMQERVGDKSATAASYFCSAAHHTHISCLKDIFAIWCGTTPRTEPSLNWQHCSCESSIFVLGG